MTGPAAFRAVYADWKLIKTRGMIQVVLELPVEQADAAYEVLGGMPVAGKERWFGIAAIRNPEATPGVSDPAPAQVPQPRPERAKRDWRDLPASQQAGIRCAEPVFHSFLEEECHDNLNEAGTYDDCVRMICGVKSRSELDTNHKARVIWHQLDSQYQAWLAKERVGA